MKHLATCCCESLQIEVDGDPSLQVICHCSNCKKRTGSAFGISAYYKDTRITNTIGASSTYRRASESGEQERYFCPNCGTTLYWTLSRLPGMTGIAGGCFADNPLPAPTVTISVDEKCPWLELPKDLKDSVSRRDFR